MVLWRGAEEKYLLAQTVGALVETLWSNHSTHQPEVLWDGYDHIWCSVRA